MKKSRLNEVIQIANSMIKEEGYSNLSFSKVAKKLDVTRENIHHYFKNKESLGLVCIDTMEEDLNKNFEEILSKDLDARSKLIEYFKFYKTQQNDRVDCPIVYLLTEYNLLPSSMQKGVKVLIDIEINNMINILELGQKSGEFNISMDLEFKANLIMTLLKGSVGYTKVFNNFDDTTKHILEDLTKNQIK